MGSVTAGFLLAPAFYRAMETKESIAPALQLLPAFDKEDIPTYIKRITGSFDINLYRKILGNANAFKEGDEIAGLAAANDEQRLMARNLIANTSLNVIIDYPIFNDNQFEMIGIDTDFDSIDKKTFGWLKNHLLTESTEAIDQLPALHSDQIACVVKLMSNEELIAISQKIFHPLPGSNIGSKGYMGARVQPNSPTDDPEDIFWQVMNAWSFAVGDVVLGTNPVSSEPESVAKIEATLQDIIQTFSLQDVIPHFPCKMSFLIVFWPTLMCKLK